MGKMKRATSSIRTHLEPHVQHERNVSYMENSPRQIQGDLQPFFGFFRKLHIYLPIFVICQPL